MHTVNEDLCLGSVVLNARVCVVGIVHNTAPLTQFSYEFGVERTECTDNDVPQVYNVKVTVVTPATSTTAAAVPVEEEEHKELTQPHAALQVNDLHADQAKVKVAPSASDSSMSSKHGFGLGLGLISACVSCIANGVV